MTDTVGTINQEMIVTLVMIHRLASRALSEEERVGQRILGDPRGEINGLLVQMSAYQFGATDASSETCRIHACVVAGPLLTAGGRNGATLQAGTGA
jgi:hypothetical protein